MPPALLEWVKSLSLNTHMIVATFLRLVLVSYGQHQDATMAVKYTDIDYRVYTDAARQVVLGNSPYDRHTYRYSPLLAYIMLPTITWSPVFGKLLFIMFDILSGYLIYRITRSDVAVGEGTARLAAAAWLYNPLVMNVSTRGSAESLIVTLVLATLHLYHKRVFFLTGVFYGLAIHFKIYPIIYCLSLYVPLTHGSGLLSLFSVNTARVRLVTATVLTLACLTALFYHLYGDVFLQETYLYHLTRRDTRHNFSVYFYLLYLTVEEDDIGINLITFLPQLVLILAVTKRFSGIHDIDFCLFCQTVVFVAFNKVVTAQYFLWYLALLPIVATKIVLTNKEVVLGALLWGFAQGSWLLPAYLLEFRGNNTFMFIWLESLAFFSANIGLLAKLIRKYREKSCKIDEQCNLLKMD